MGVEKTKRELENGWASILLRYLNSAGYDYIIRERHIQDGWADVDVCAKSDSGKYPPLYIQLCLDVNPKDPGFEKTGKSSKIFTKFGQTMEAIKAKAEKYKKQNVDFSQITLAVQSYYLIKDDEIYRVPQLRNECRKYKFKAIYLLSPKGQFVDGTEDKERVFQLF